MEEAQSELDEGRQEVEDGKKELEDAKKELEDARSEAESELADAESELLEGESELEEGKQELEDAREEVKEGESELAKGESELAEKESELADGQRQLEDARVKLEEGESTLKDSEKKYQEELAPAQKKLTEAQEQINQGKQELEEGWTTYYEKSGELDEGKLQYQEGVAQLAEARQQYNAGMAQLQKGQEEYDAGAAELKKGQEEYDAGAEELARGQAEYDAGVQQMADAQAEYDSGRKELEEGQKAYEAGITELEKKKTEYRQSVQALEQQITELEEAEKAPDDEEHSSESDQQLEEKRAELEAQLAALAGVKTQLDAQDQELAGVKQELDANTEKLNAAKQELDEGYAKLDASKAELDAGYEELAAAKRELDAGYAQLESSKSELDEGYRQMEEAQEEIVKGEKQLSDSKKELEKGEIQLKEAKAQLEDSEIQLADGQKEIDEGYQQLADGQAQLSKARNELDQGWGEWQDSSEQLADGQSQLADAKKQLEDARSELEDGRQQIADGEKEIEENQQKLSDGWEEYREGKQTAEDEIAEAEQKIRDAEKELEDAQQKIADGEEEIAKIKYPEWYVYDRTVLPENSGYGENAERMSKIGEVFPVLFFLVAALISLTTMTRMVEKERTQIGTLKALGYGKAAIASKYLKYALLATLGGSILGILVGEKIIPWIIINAYGIVYLHTPQVLTPYNWAYGILAAVAALICTVGAAWSSCFRELQDVPASLMRPPAPKQGKRILLERLPFLWKHLGFTWKSTMRNLMRYKKRCLMTVIGIGGCMGLLLVGYGLRDSIMDIAVLQFDELHHYDAIVILDEDASEIERQQVTLELEAEDRLEESGLVYMQSVNVKPDHEMKDQKEWTARIVVPQEMEEMDTFFTLRDRKSGEQYSLGTEGAVITEKLASKLDLEPGSMLLLEDEDKEIVQVPIAAVCENYLAHYVYLTPKLYRSAFGREPDYNSVMVIAGEGREEELQQVGTEILKQEGAVSVTYAYTMKEQMESMLEAMDLVMVVLIISAGMLAFVVLYNLNNINISERKRELATLKVLGFFDGEVASYVYRENVLLTAVGAVAGIFIGKVLHLFIIGTVEVDSCMFGRTIKPVSYLYGVLFTVGFSLIVNGVMYFKLKKIDMVESLKSIE